MRSDAREVEGSGVRREEETEAPAQGLRRHRIRFKVLRGEAWAPGGETGESLGLTVGLKVKSFETFRRGGDALERFGIFSGVEWERGGGDDNRWIESFGEPTIFVLVSFKK